MFADLSWENMASIFKAINLTISVIIVYFLLSLLLEPEDLGFTSLRAFGKLVTKYVLLQSGTLCPS
jgi:hypothetical protein